MRSDVREWLLQGEPWIRNAVLEHEGAATSSSRAAAAADTPIKTLAAEVSNWPWPPINSHKAVGHPLHLLCFLADLGIGAEALGIDQLLDKILDAQLDEGPLRQPMAIPVRYGGSGVTEMAWVLCDAPLLTWALAAFERSGDPRVEASAEALNQFGRDNGWPCVACAELKRFRGPGRKTDPCPYANLIMLQLNSALPSFTEAESTRLGVGSALRLWEVSREEHPYMFFMGTDFRKLKAPLAWYDILHVADVLSRFPFARHDRRMQDMVAAITAQADPNGRYSPGSVWQRWKGWEFSRKAVPSRYITLRVSIIEDKMGSD
jgi:hypothetical protein